MIISCNNHLEEINKQTNGSTKQKLINELIDAELAKQKQGLVINYKDFYDKLIKIDSSDKNIKIKHAYSTLYSNDQAASIREFRALVKKENTNADALFGLGIAFYKINVDSSFYYCEKAIAISHNDNLKILDLSALYNEQQMFEKAISTIDKAIKNLPKNTGLLFHRASYKIGNADFESALMDMDTLPEGHKNDVSVYFNRAVCFLYLKKDKECIEQAGIAIKLNPLSDSNIYFIRAKARSHLGDREGTYEDLKKAVELGNKEAIPYYQKASEYFKTHKKG